MRVPEKAIMYNQLTTGELWGRVYDLGDGTVVKTARERCAGIGSGRQKIESEYAALTFIAAAGGLGRLVPAPCGCGDIPASSLLAKEGFSCWLQMTKMHGVCRKCAVRRHHWGTHGPIGTRQIRWQRSRVQEATDCPIGKARAVGGPMALPPLEQRAQAATDDAVDADRFAPRATTGMSQLAPTVQMANLRTKKATPRTIVRLMLRR
jgi:hypothetical protein